MRRSPWCNLSPHFPQHSQPRRQTLRQRWTCTWWWRVALITGVDYAWKYLLLLLLLPLLLPLLLVAPLPPTCPSSLLTLLQCLLGFSARLPLVYLGLT